MLACFGCLAMTSCDRISDRNVIARVGDVTLTRAEVEMQVPLGKNREDSLQFAQEYISQWVERQLFMQQGLKNLPNISELEAQVNDYRTRLISQTYETQILSERVGEVSDRECETFWEKHRLEMPTPIPLVEGISVKLESRSEKIRTVREWLEKLAHNETEVMGELEDFCRQHAAVYDNQFEKWVTLQKLTDHIPAQVQKGRDFLRQGVHEMKDEDFVYFLLVRDFVKAGSSQPYDYAKDNIRERLTQERRQQFHQHLLQSLLREGKKDGTVVINYE